MSMPLSRGSARQLLAAVLVQVLPATGPARRLAIGTHFRSHFPLRSSCAHQQSILLQLRRTPTRLSDGVPQQILNLHLGSGQFNSESLHP